MSVKTNKIEPSVASLKRELGELRVMIQLKDARIKDLLAHNSRFEQEARDARKDAKSAQTAAAAIDDRLEQSRELMRQAIKSLDVGVTRRSEEFTVPWMPNFPREFLFKSGR